MDDNIFKRAIEYLPTFFDTQLQFDPLGAGIFEPLKKIIDFDEAYIFYLNPDSLRMKYLYGKDRTYSVNDVFAITDDMKGDLFSPVNIVFDNNKDIIKSLNLSKFNSFLTSKLVIRETVYGFVLLCKYEDGYYKQNEIDVSTAIGSVISYKIKDVELSEVFDSQLKALKEGFEQTRAAYKTIEKQNLKILEADKVKTEFLANISHELRTPLNAIIGFSEMLSTKLFGDLNEKQAEYVNDISVSGIHLLGMINELLDISKIEAKAMTLNQSLFLVSQAIDEVVNIIKPLAIKKEIKIITKVPKAGEVFADFQKIRQILYNLLSNAIKFSHNGDKIEVDVKLNKNNFIIEIKDYGIGIAQKDHERIFEKFIQLESAYTKSESSTGLGLTITKELVEMHNGHIAVKSSIGKGATFIVTIPNSHNSI